jgi:hypothetical protein
MLPHVSHDAAKIVCLVRLAEQRGDAPTVRVGYVEADSTAGDYDMHMRPVAPNVAYQLPAVHAAAESEIRQEHIERLSAALLKCFFGGGNQGHLMPIWAQDTPDGASDRSIIVHHQNA